MQQFFAKKDGFPVADFFFKTALLFEKEVGLDNKNESYGVNSLELTGPKLIVLNRETESESKNEEVRIFFFFSPFYPKQKKITCLS